MKRGQNQESGRPGKKIGDCLSLHFQTSSFPGMDPNTEKRINEQMTYKYLDLLLLRVPDVGDFHLSNYIPDLEEYLGMPQGTISPLEQDIKTALIELGYACPSKQILSDTSSFFSIKLTPQGREVKKRGGHFKYEEHLEKQRRMTEENLHLQNKTLRRKFKYGAIGMAIGYALGFITSNFEWLRSLFK